MKVTRSFWLGLGSGLVLSGLLTMAFSPLQGLTAKPRNSATEASIQQTPLTPSESVKPSVETQPTQVKQPVAQSSAIPKDQSFVIPEGASAERIAGLLVAQGFIKDKETFLVNARQLGVERRFKAGTFNLMTGLSTEELLHRLVPK